MCLYHHHHHHHIHVFTAAEEPHTGSLFKLHISKAFYMRLYLIQGGSNMTGTDLYVNKPHCAAAVRP